MTDPTGIPEATTREDEGFSYSTIKCPEYSEWHCYLFGTDNYVLNPIKGQEPNWFWRWMQYLAFGNRWVRHPKGGSHEAE